MGKLSKGVKMQYKGLYRVVVVLAVIALISSGCFDEARRKKQRLGCFNNLKHIAIAIAMYATDHEDTFPVTKGWEQTLKNDYFDGKDKVYVCPGCLMHYKYLGNGQNMKDFKDNQSKTMLVICEGEHFGMTNVIFLDGHGEQLDTDIVKSAVAKAGNGNLPVMK